MPMNNHRFPAILADFRERPSGIPRLISGEGMNVCLTILTTGDYLINNMVLIKWKSAEDFIHSLVSGRSSAPAWIKPVIHRFCCLKKSLPNGT